MNSFISHFKPWLWALLTLAAIELTYYGVMRPPRATWNNFLNFDFAQTESFQRLVAHDKIVAFEKADPDVIQVGDSSGLHGVQSPIVMSHIPGWNYLNMSVATNLGYSGYYNMARLQLERSPHARYLVLYTSPLGGVPRRILWDDDQKLMAPHIYNEFISPLHQLFQLPTLAARKDVTNYVYYLGHRFKQRDAPLSNNRGYLAFSAVFRESNGWTRETDVEGDIRANIFKGILPNIEVGDNVNPDLVRTALRMLPKVTDEHFYDWWTFSDVSYFDHVYDAFAELAKAYGVKLVLVFNPLPDSTKRAEFEELMDWKAIRSGLDRVRRRHPDVVVSNIDFWPDEHFSVFSHIGTPSSLESSHRVGRIMKDIIGGDRPVERAKVEPVFKPPMTVEIDFEKTYCGYGWTDQTGATDQFPLQHVGPRNKGWIFTAVRPNHAYTVRGVFNDRDPELVRRMKMTVNDEPVTKTSAGRSNEASYAEYLVPEDVVNKYDGWLNIRFDLGDADRKTTAIGRSTQFKRITVSPVKSR